MLGGTGLDCEYELTARKSVRADCLKRLAHSSEKRNWRTYGPWIRRATTLFICAGSAAAGGGTTVRVGAGAVEGAATGGGFEGVLGA